MRLAEALILRADIQKRIEQLRLRIVRNAKVQDGDKPAEDPNKLLQELQEITSNLEVLVQRINRTNAGTDFGNGKTVADVIATRDRLKLLQNIYRELAKEGTITQTRYSKSEVKFKSSVNVAEIQKQADTFAKEYRKLDTEIQTINWDTELVE